MPSIRSMMLGPEAEDPNFNLDDFLREAAAAADASPASQYSEMGVAPVVEEERETPATETAPVSTEAETGEETEVGTDEGPSPSPVAAPVLDPLAELPADRRNALLLIDRALSDPEVQGRVMEAIKPPPPAPRPTLPDHVDPESVEGMLWQQNQAIMDRLDQEREERRQAQIAQTESQRLGQAAAAAGQNFGQRYNLEPDEVLTLAQRAGSSGLPQALVASGKDPQAAYEQALEVSLFQDPVLRARVVGDPSSVAPTPVLGPTPAGEEKKRVLHALSGAATPVAGPPPRREALETRADGRLTPSSRSTLVQELATTLKSRGTE